MKLSDSPEYLLIRNKWMKECWSFVEKAEYKKATVHAQKALKKFPKDKVVKFNYYSILADYALSNDSKKFKKLHAKAVKGMERALKNPGDISPKHLYQLKNEFFFQTKQYKKQYYLGQLTARKTKELNPYYSSGVGAAHYALELALKNKKKAAQAWAEKSVVAWKKYFEFEKKYYNPYVHLALAYGVLGEKRKMMASLRKSSKLCQKPMTYEEFSWTQKIVSEIPYLQNE